MSRGQADRISPSRLFKHFQPVPALGPSQGRWLQRCLQVSICPWLKDFGRFAPRCSLRLPGPFSQLLHFILLGQHLPDQPMHQANVSIHTETALRFRPHILRPFVDLIHQIPRLIHSILLSLLLLRPLLPEPKTTHLRNDKNRHDNRNNSRQYCFMLIPNLSSMTIKSSPLPGDKGDLHYCNIFAIVSGRTDSI